MYFTYRFFPRVDTNEQLLLSIYIVVTKYAIFRQTWCPLFHFCHKMEGYGSYKKSSHFTLFSLWIRFQFLAFISWNFLISTTKNQSHFRRSVNGLVLTWTEEGLEPCGSWAVVQNYQRAWRPLTRLSAVQSIFWVIVSSESWVYTYIVWLSGLLGF